MIVITVLNISACRLCAGGRNNNNNNNNNNKDLLSIAADS